MRFSIEKLHYRFISRYRSLVKLNFFKRNRWFSYKNTKHKNKGYGGDPRGGGGTFSRLHRYTRSQGKIFPGKTHPMRWKHICTPLDAITEWFILIVILTCKAKCKSTHLIKYGILVNCLGHINHKRNSSTLNLNGLCCINLKHN